MEERLNRVVSPPTEVGAAEERMLRADLVREMVARKERGEGAKRIARELGVDRKTVKRWLKLGSWQPRRSAIPAPADRSVCRVHRAARAGGRVERGGCTSRAGGLGVYRRVSASATFSAAISGAAEVVGTRDGTLRDRARRAGSGRLRSTKGLDRRAGGERSICSCSPWAIRAGCMRESVGNFVFVSHTMKPAGPGGRYGNEQGRAESRMRWWTSFWRDGIRRRCSRPGVWSTS